jgi:hypothetical protein
MVRRVWLFCLLFLVAFTPVYAQSPCDTSLATRALFPSTATSVAVALRSPDHGNVDKVAEYQVNVYAPSNLTTPLSQQVFTRAAVTLAGGTTDCYIATLNRAAVLNADTDYVVKATVRGPAGEADYTAQSNPFVFPSRPVLSGVRVPRP